MRRILPALLLLLVACGADGPTDAQKDWLAVLQQKKAAMAANATTKDKQAYADSLAAFVRKHPKHGRARDVYQRMQLEFADELSQRGRHQDAIRFYRAVLRHEPANLAAQQGIEQAMDRLAVSRARLLALEKGMTEKQVAAILGKPIPGWRVENRERDPKIECWYYRTTEGSVAGVYFRDGRLFAAEESSDAKVASLR